MKEEGNPKKKRNGGKRKQSKWERPRDRTMKGVEGCVGKRTERDGGQQTA